MSGIFLSCILFLASVTLFLSSEFRAQSLVQSGSGPAPRLASTVRLDKSLSSDNRLKELLDISVWSSAGEEDYDDDKEASVTLFLSSEFRAESLVQSGSGPGPRLASTVRLDKSLSSDSRWKELLDISVWSSEGEEDSDDEEEGYDAVSSPGCDDYKIMPNGTFPVIALASLQGSGNTWTRLLIQGVTGFATGSLYTSNLKGLQGEMCDAKSGETIVVKAHGFRDWFEGAVLIVRNPYSAIIADYNRIHSNKTGLAPPTTFQGEEWNLFVKRRSREWLQLYKTFIASGKPLHILYYEHMKENLREELRQVAKFLNVEVDEKRLNCAVNQPFDTFKRKGRVEKIDPFSSEQRKLIDDKIPSLEKILKKSNYPHLPSSYYRYPGPF
ncbi:sialate:O-sulfotransferase 1-like [Diadema setosum]|uniref:sialate:O-sulfotransferase 1-like n=1 Tax=Diadema setosum TaxID=31175 RepID=UPI003B3AA8CB